MLYLVTAVRYPLEGFELVTTDAFNITILLDKIVTAFLTLELEN